MHVFIVRPFGTKNNINFDRVETELIRPAMRAAGLTGGTTGEFVQQGNIRTDMFEQLLIADIVIADISIHNANVFYELGLRHALRDKRTFLLKSVSDEVPFDLKTDRYLPYSGFHMRAFIKSGHWCRFSRQYRSHATENRYKSALAGADAQVKESVRNQLVLYQQLGILTENTQAALPNVAASAEKNAPEQAAPRVILFTGHRIDAAGREQPRFPRTKETQARALIRDAVVAEQQKATGQLLGIAGGASGGDILFHEVCQELGIPTLLYLALPQDAYRAASVADGGAQWVERFQHLCEVNKPILLTDADELPRWLRAKNGYTIWQRANLWMLQHALAKSNDNLLLIALWNGDVGDGPGGTEDMVKRAQERGAAFIHLDTRMLLIGP